MFIISLKNIFDSQKEFFYADTTLPINFRLIHLSKLKKCLIENEHEIYDSLYKDLGKSKEDSLTSEFYYCIKEINYFLKKLYFLAKPEKIKSSFINFKSKGYIYKKPYGVSLIISTWNYPLLLSIVPLIGTIAAGNTCILKLHPFSQNTNRVIKKIISNIFEQCYVHYVQDDEYPLDSLLELNFDYIFSTSGSETGKFIYSKASERLIPITLELGGKNPCIVHKDANIEVACKRIAHGKFFNSGQTCLAPDYILVHKDIKKAFINELKKSIEELYSSDPLKSKHYSKIINLKHFNRLKDLINSQKENIILHGKFDEENLKISPFIMDSKNSSSFLFKDEIFGPILEIKEFEIIDDVIYALKKSTPPLSLYLFSKNKALINKCIEIPFGGGCINDTVLHNIEINLPFGGFKNSGIGNYHGKYSFNTFTHKKSILIKSTKIDLNFRYPNSKKYNFKKIKKLLRM